MTEPLSIKDLNCGNCTDRYKPECPYYAWIELGNCGISRDSYFEFTSLVGCLSHPGARAYLNKSVIEDLERRSTEMFDSGVPMMISIKEVIALLRGDGE